MERPLYSLRKRTENSPFDLANEAGYAAWPSTPPHRRDPDKAIPGSLGKQFGLMELDYNMEADDDGVMSLRVVESKWRIIILSWHPQ